MRSGLSLSLLCAAVLGGAAARGGGVGYTVATPAGFELVARGAHGGTLHAVNLTSSRYGAQSPVRVLNLFGSGLEMGEDMGQLVGPAFAANYAALLDSIVGPDAFLQDLLGDVLDWQWEDWLSRQTPQEFLDEIQGFGNTFNGSAGAKVVSRGVVLANLPGDLTDMWRVLLDELVHGDGKERFGALERKAKRGGYAGLYEALSAMRKWPGHGCSMLGAWGKRTVGGEVFTGRNLDWEADTGINRNKLVTVFHPSKGHAHAVVGFAGISGALTGMSAKGLSVHEANLEEAQESFRGFPWLYRLRYVMANAKDLESGLALFNATENTVGFNFGLGSASDKEMRVLETEWNYTAVFGANDPREAAAQDGGRQVGFPLPDAVWRTNNGFDPKIRADFLWSQSFSSNTQYRYRLIRDTFLDYEHSSTPIGALQMVNATAIVGQKGNASDFYRCPPQGTPGTNVLSVAYDLAASTLYAAWEAGSNQTWVAAGCSTYVKLDMTQWFQAKPAL